jgi:hypothetical protein
MQGGGQGEEDQLAREPAFVHAALLTRFPRTIQRALASAALFNAETMFDRFCWREDQRPYLA